MQFSTGDRGDPARLALTHMSSKLSGMFATSDFASSLRFLRSIMASSQDENDQLLNWLSTDCIHLQGKIRHFKFRKWNETLHTHSEARTRIWEDDIDNESLALPALMVAVRVVYASQTESTKKQDFCEVMSGDIVLRDTRTNITHLVEIQTLLQLYHLQIHVVIKHPSVVRLFWRPLPIAIFTVVNVDSIFKNTPCPLFAKALALGQRKGLVLSLLPPEAHRVEWVRMRGEYA